MPAAAWVAGALHGASQQQWYSGQPLDVESVQGMQGNARAAPVAASSRSRLCMRSTCKLAPLPCLPTQGGKKAAAGGGKKAAAGSKRKQPAKAEAGEEGEEQAAEESKAAAAAPKWGTVKVNADEPGACGACSGSTASAWEAGWMQHLPEDAHAGVPLAAQAAPNCCVTALPAERAAPILKLQA